MTVEEGREFFDAVPFIARKLQTLIDVGLSYIRLGQSAVTLSGGEAQRVILAKELSKRDTGKTLYILDEPTTGLHFYDIQQLLNVLERLRDHGNTIVVTEHNLDVIKTADWIVDRTRGWFWWRADCCRGNPEEVAENPASHTGRYPETNALSNSPPEERAQKNREPHEPGFFRLNEDFTLRLRPLLQLRCPEDGRPALQCHRGIVASTETALQNTKVTTRTLAVTGAQLIKQLGYRSIATQA